MIWWTNKICKRQDREVELLDLFSQENIFVHHRQIEDSTGKTSWMEDFGNIMEMWDKMISWEAALVDFVALVALVAPVALYGCCGGKSV